MWCKKMIAVGLGYCRRSFPVVTILLHYIRILLHYFLLDMSSEDKLYFAFDELSLRAFSP